MPSSDIAMPLTCASGYNYCPSFLSHLALTADGTPGDVKRALEIACVPYTDDKPDEELHAVQCEASERMLQLVRGLL